MPAFPREFRAVVAIMALVAVLPGCSGSRPTAPTAPAPKASAAVPPPAAVECRFTEKPPTIDGDLDDDAWKNAATIDNFAMPWLGIGPSGGFPKPEKAVSYVSLVDCIK